MFDLEAVKVIAEKHLSKVDLPHPDYYFVLPEARETPEGWIFTYRTKSRNPDSTKRSGGFGGAPAFIVLRQSGEVRNLTWQQFSSIEASFRDQK